MEEESLDMKTHKKPLSSFWPMMSTEKEKMRDRAFGLEVETLGMMSVSHIRVPGVNFHLWLLIPVFC